MVVRELFYIHRAMGECNMKKGRYSGSKNILIIEDNDINRVQLTEILAQRYALHFTRDGKEAHDVLEELQDGVALVLADFKLMKQESFELIHQMRRMKVYRHTPIVLTSEASPADYAEYEKLEETGAQEEITDFLMKPFYRSIVLKRVESLILLYETTNIINALEKDALTGAYTKEFFYREVQNYLKENPEESLYMWVSDIEGLKIINEKYGIEMGDAIIRLQEKAREKVEGFLFGGRIEGDKLAALVQERAVPYIEELTQKADMGIEFPISKVVIRNGLYRIRKHTTLMAQGMYDRAILAINRIKDTYGIYLSVYNDVLKKDILAQRQVVENAETALEKRQFVVYYQPKFDLLNGKTGGAEALVRWISPEFGFMNPGVFIPLFEKSGFIRKLDYYVWEEVCREMKEWKESGKPTVPISVNVSRRDFEDENLAEKIIGLVDSYGIEHELFHIEVTESAYSDNPEQITKTVKAFHEAGFVVELDDFGAGYSSMSALSEMDIDILKLDMSIVQKDNPRAEKSVLECSMKLAKMLKFKIVAEGVETNEQVERISSLGGEYIQGFFYSKPIPKDEFERYLMKEQ